MKIVVKNVVVAVFLSIIYCCLSLFCLCGLIITSLSGDLTNWV